MSIVDYAKDRLEWDRTKKRSIKYESSISMEPGEELLRTKMDHVLRIMRWFIDRKFSESGVEFLGGEDEMIQNAMIYLLRWKPKIPVTLSTRCCKAVLWASGREKYMINRRLEARMERKPFAMGICRREKSFDVVDQQDLDEGLWRQCARIVKNDRQHDILMRDFHNEDQTVIAKEQGVTRQMISLLKIKAMEKLQKKRDDLMELNEMFVGVK